MKFSGQIKFPEIDHPGVPIRIVIEGSQIELVVEGESLGRWSLYDVHARRLVASAFQIDLDGTEVTFVADDPIDFAYRGVEYMAETWAGIKSKRLAARSLAVRKSRKDIIPSRIEEMKEAMMANLEGRSEPRQLAGEVSMPEAPEADLAGESPVEEIVTAEATVPGGTVSEETTWVEEERRRLAEERAQLEEERRRAEEREANRIEAYRIEMARLKAEREELQRRAEELAQGAVPDGEVRVEPDLASASDPEPVAAEIPEPEPEPEHETEPGPEPEPTAEEDPVDEPEPVLEEPEPDDEPEPVLEEPEPDDEPEPVLEEPELEPEPVASEPERDDEPEPAVVGALPVVDLSDLEHEPESLPDPDKDPAGVARQPAMAGAARQRGGLMGAVRAAFRSSAREHDHQFVEAPGGIGITRYVCEECGYVSISA